MLHPHCHLAHIENVIININNGKYVLYIYITKKIFPPWFTFIGKILETVDWGKVVTLTRRPLAVFDHIYIQTAQPHSHFFFDTRWYTNQWSSCFTEVYLLTATCSLLYWTFYNSMPQLYNGVRIKHVQSNQLCLSILSMFVNKSCWSSGTLHSHGNQLLPHLLKLVITWCMQQLTCMRSLQ